MWGAHERFIDTYFTMYDNVYFTGDGCRLDEEGDYWLLGRIDDVVNVSGHRIGTAEVESALVSHPSVSEAAVVAMPHEIKGQALYAYVTPRKGVEPSDDLVKALMDHVRKEIGPIARPEVIQFADGLPKTRSGKIMRRILRKIAEGETGRSRRHNNSRRPYCGRNAHRRTQATGGWSTSSIGRAETGEESYAHRA